MQLIPLFGDQHARGRYYAMTRIFCDPSKDTTEDMWFEVQNGRYPVQAFKQFVSAKYSFVYCTNKGYPVYFVAVDDTGCVITASTPLVEKNRVGMTKAISRFMQTPEGDRMFRSTHSGVEWSDMNKTRLNWTKFLGFTPVSVSMKPRLVMRVIGHRETKEIPYPASLWARIFYRPDLIRLVYERK